LEKCGQRSPGAAERRANTSRCDKSAKAALDGNDFGVGIEAGVVEIFELPEIFKKEILKGKVFGTVADEYFKTKNIKHDGGAIKVLSNNLISRDDLTSEFYGNNKIQKS